MFYLMGTHEVTVLTALSMKRGTRRPLCEAFAFGVDATDETQLLRKYNSANIASLLDISQKIQANTY